MTPFIPVPCLRARGKSQICPSNLLHREKKICRIASIGHHVVKRECTQSKVLRTETLLIPTINLNISRTSYQENCATVFQPYPSSWLHAWKQVGRGEKCTFPGAGICFGRGAKFRTIWKCLSPSSQCRILTGSENKWAWALSAHLCLHGRNSRRCRSNGGHFLFCPMEPRGQWAPLTRDAVERGMVCSRFNGEGDFAVKRLV